MKRLLFLVLILVSCGLYAQSVGPFSPQEVGGISSILSPVKFGGKKLPSWLTSEYSPIFNGVNQYAITPSVSWPPSSGGFSVGFWVKRFDIGLSGSKYIFRAKNNLAGRMTIYTDQTSNVYIFNQGNNASSRYATAFPANSVWTHIAYTNPGAVPLSSGSLYINGGLVAWTAHTSATSTPFVGAADEILFGGNFAAQCAGMSLAEAVFWGRELSASDIQRYYLKRLRGSEAGLVALYHMSDNAQTLIDSCSNGTPKNAIASNSVAWTKRNGYAAPDVRSERYALSFDGVDDYASAPCDVSTYPFTLSAWAFTPALAASRGVFFGIFNNASTTQDVYAGVLNDAGVYRALGVVTNGGSVVTASSTGAFLGRWTNITLVGESSILRKLFIDGVQTATSTTEIQFPSAVSHYGIGVLNRATKAYSFGKFAHFTAWDKALSQAEISALIYSPAPNLSDANLRKYVEITEGTGASLADLSDANVNLTLYNSPTWVGRDIP